MPYSIEPIGRDRLDVLLSEVKNFFLIRSLNRF